MRKFRDRSNPKISVMSYTKCIECGKMLYPNEIYDAKYCKECAEIIKTAKKLSYIQCVHCHQYFPQERIITFGKLNLNYCTFCSSKLIKCKYCGEKFIPTEFDELVCPECFDSKSKTCIKCGMDFIPNERHRNICFDCFISENDTETADNIIENSQEDTILEISEINVDSLVSLFNNLDKRTETSEYLAKQGCAVINPLIECLGEEDEIVRNYALKTLVLIGQPAVESLIDGLEYINDNQRLSCVKALGEIGDISAIDPIIEILQNDYVFKIRRTAVEALALINNESALEPILELLKEETDPRIKTTCALAVGDLANENGLKVLIETLNDDDDKSVVKSFCC